MASQKLVDGSLPVLVSELLNSLASEEVVDFLREIVGLNVQLEILENLSSISMVLQDAEEKQLEDTFVSLWLHKLREVTRDLDDVIDDIKINALLWKKEGESSNLSYFEESLKPKILMVFRRIHIFERTNYPGLTKYKSRHSQRSHHPATLRSEESGSDGSTPYSISVPSWKYDVYVSFRGEDVRRSFVDQLFKAFRLNGIVSLGDDQLGMEKGLELSKALLKAIEESRVVIVIFSEGYASSTFCLEELVTIVECHKKKGQKVIPVFFGVDPSHVRKQTAEYAVAFAELEHRYEDRMDKVMRWRNALTATASLSGWDSTTFRPESLLIDKIVEEVLRMSYSSCSGTANNDLVGMELYLKEMQSYLDKEQFDVRTVGICGTGGIGKTTIAYEVFSILHHQFEASCFLADVRQKYRKHDLVHLQEELYEVLLNSKQKMQNVTRGSNILRQGLRSLKVLIVLDDVSNLDQIEALVGKAKEQSTWFGRGSRVIVTSRYKPLLERYGANYIYEVKKLTDDDALMLFSREVFKDSHPPDDYKAISLQIVKLAGGLPLALKYIGSSLCGRNKDEWSRKVKQIKEKLASVLQWNLQEEADPDENLSGENLKTPATKISQLSKSREHPPPKGSIQLSQFTVSLSSLRSENPSSFSNIDEEQDLCGHQGSGASVAVTRKEQLLKSGDKNTNRSIELGDSLGSTENQPGATRSSTDNLSSQEDVDLRGQNLTRGLEQSFLHVPNILQLSFSGPNKLQLLTIQSDNEDSTQSPTPVKDWTKLPPFPVPLEPTDVLFPSFIQESIDDGKLFGISFPCTRIPNWCGHGNSESFISIKLSQEDYSSIKGIALYVVFVIKETDAGIDEGFEKNIHCHFHVNEYQLENLVIFQNFECIGAGSFGICCYLSPEWLLSGQLTKSIESIEVSISMQGPNAELKMCGIHLIFEKDVVEFSEQLAQTVNEHRDVVWDFSRHCKQLLHRTAKLESFGEVISIEGQTTPREPHLRGGQQSCIAEDFSPTIDQCSDSISQMSSNIRSLLLKIFQGQYALCNRFYFDIPLRIFSPWFSHNCVGDTAICCLPPNLYDDKSWVGLELYVVFKRLPYVSHGNPDSDKIPSLLLVDLYAHGNNTLPIITYPLLIDIDSFGFHSVFSHVPRECFSEQLKQCQGISVLFRSSAPDLEVEICGTRLLYKQDLESLIQVIVESTKGKEKSLHLLHEQAEMYLKGKTSRRDAVEQEYPHFGLFSDFEREQIGFLQKLLTSGTEQVAEEDDTSLTFSLSHGEPYKEFQPILLHSRHWTFDNQEYVHEIAGVGQSRDLTPGFSHLHIMAETFLAHGSSQSLNWKRKLKLKLENSFKDCTLVTLSLKGNIISALKTFDPCSTYNFCFPKKNVPEWFLHDQQIMSTKRIELPPDLHKDNNWRGLAMFAAFSVDDHQTVLPSYFPFKILCHLATGECHLTTGEWHCLNPVPMLSVTKKKVKWLDHGFIWVTYVPHWLLAELNEQSYVMARFFFDCPSLKVETCAIRLLYQQDVGEFKQNIIRCWSTFFDNLECIDQFVADED